MATISDIAIILRNTVNSKMRFLTKLINVGMIMMRKACLWGKKIHERRFESNAKLPVINLLSLLLLFVY